MFTCRFVIRYLAVIALLLLQGTSQAAITLLEKDDWKAQFFGFAEFDLNYDTTRSFLETIGGNPVARPASLSGENGRMQSSVRNSRFGFVVMAPPQGDWKSKGYLEFDMLGAANGTSEGSLFTAPTVRLRHAFVAAESEGFQILAGQYWTLFGWQMAYILPSVSVAPLPGVLYERTPQLLAMKAFGPLQGALAIARPVQRDSMLPTFDGGLRYSFESWKGAYANGATAEEGVQPMSLALTGTVRDVATPAGTASATDKSHQTAYGVALDAMVPIIPSSDGKDVGNSLVLSGEATTGQGYTDEFTAWNGNLKQLTATENSFAPTSVNLDAGIGGFDAGGVFHLVKLNTFNLNLQYHLPTEWHTWINLGYGQLHSSNAASLGPVNGTPYFRNEVLFGNIYHDFSKQVRAALEYSYLRMKYGDGTEPHNHRFQISAWFRI